LVDAGDALAEVVMGKLEDRPSRYSNYKAWFREMDTNRSGYLSKTEMRRALAKLEVQLTLEELRWVFARFDTNGDGLISLSEFVAFMERERQGYAHYEAPEWFADHGPHEDPFDAPPAAGMRDVPRATPTVAINIDALHSRVRRQLHSREDRLRHLGPALRRADKCGGGSLDAAQLRKALGTVGIKLSVAEALGLASSVGASINRSADVSRSGRQPRARLVQDEVQIEEFMRMVESWPSAKHLGTGRAHKSEIADFCNGAGRAHYIRIDADLADTRDAESARRGGDRQTGIGGGYKSKRERDPSKRGQRNPGMVDDRALDAGLEEEIELAMEAEEHEEQVWIETRKNAARARARAKGRRSLSTDEWDIEVARGAGLGTDEQDAEVWARPVIDSRPHFDSQTRPRRQQQSQQSRTVAAARGESRTLARPGVSEGAYSVPFASSAAGPLRSGHNGTSSEANWSNHYQRGREGGNKSSTGSKSAEWNGVETLWKGGGSGRASRLSVGVHGGPRAFHR
jgi:Ca2+-binding EF-hand superfamily protein